MCDCDGRTSLHFAASEGHYNIALKINVDFNVKVSAFTYMLRNLLHVIYIYIIYTQKFILS